LAENQQLTELFDDLCETYREQCHQHKKLKVQRKEEEETEEEAFDNLPPAEDHFTPEASSTLPIYKSISPSSSGLLPHHEEESILPAELDFDSLLLLPNVSALSEGDIQTIVGGAFLEAASQAPVPSDAEVRAGLEAAPKLQCRVMLKCERW
jgi:hypothetical protein